MRGKRITSVDVAAEAGVSQATVARVFGSPEIVAAATRARVEAAAERLGYVPNAIAASLKSQRTNIVGAVFPSEGEYWQHVLTAFSRQLAAKGKQLLVFSFADPEQVDSVLDSVAGYRVDGVILASAKIGQTHLARMQDSPTPVVAFNQPAAAGIVPSVSVDNEEGARTLADHLVSEGSKTVTFVGGLAEASSDQIRYRGAVEQLAERGIACPYIEAGSFTYDDGFKLAGELVERPLPDALMVAGDELAFGVLDGLRASGIDIPGDVLLTGFDGLPQASWNGYDLTTIVQTTDVLVEHAIDTVLRRGNPTDTLVPGELRIGATTTRNANA